MNRARFAFAATLVGALGFGGLTLSAQQTKAPETKAPELKSVLAGRKFTPPLRGAAEVDFLRAPTKRDGNMLITKIQVKNMSPACCSRARSRPSRSRRRRTPRCRGACSSSATPTAPCRSPIR